MAPVGGLIDGSACHCLVPVFRKYSPISLHRMACIMYLQTSRSIAPKDWFGLLFRKMMRLQDNYRSGFDVNGFRLVHSAGGVYQATRLHRKVPNRFRNSVSIIYLW